MHKAIDATMCLRMCFLVLIAQIVAENNGTLLLATQFNVFLLLLSYVGVYYDDS